ncbi:MAG: type IV toxin-antitoxin system AbiEi family antitoxin domain-containing protein [Actinomycetia bacterium]|nr:type IV toxin-antitoxin system AbiEi family antitoxin domain-containing protein [Actinomycetes bacterium]
MIPRTRIPTEARTLASRQAGAISARQLHDLGLSRHVVERLHDDGALRTLTRGIYALETGGWMQWVWGAVLAGGTHAVIGGLAAARLLDLRAEEPPVIDCYCGEGIHRTSPGPWRLIQASRRPAGHHDPPRTSVVQTIVDASVGLDADAVAAMVARAGRRVHGSEVKAVMSAIERHPQRAVLQDAFDDIAAGAQSALEIRYVRDVERRHGLPTAQRQANPSGRARVDAWYVDFGLIVETDGRAYHAGLAASGDAARDNLHLELGLVTLRFTWNQVKTDPCSVARQVARALRRGGWTGELRACTRCRVIGK